MTANGFLRFRPDMMSAPVANTDLESGLRHAVERHEIIVHYQPIVNVTAGDVTHVEALVRWRRADELLSPLDFIPAAESTGLINSLGQEILALACRQVYDWLAGAGMRSVAVNVSAVQLREPDFARDILTILAATGVDPRQLIIEVTESACLGSPRRVIEQLSHMRERGIRVALDDFGTGYSTLARLRELPVDIIKVDKSFIDEVKTGRENLPILNSIIDLGHTLGLHVTVEGVETAAQARHLRRLGCDSMQGFYFGRPAAVEFLDDLEWQAGDAFRKLTQSPR
jgi:EAL domain-containing protein (putative c-di-GMP-specific phosphodiesterase class I)